MYARSSNAFVLSLSFHAGVVMLLFGVAFVAQRSGPPPVHVFELVAGPATIPTPPRLRPWHAGRGCRSEDPDITGSPRDQACAGGAGEARAAGMVKPAVRPEPKIPSKNAFCDRTEDFLQRFRPKTRCACSVEAGRVRIVGTKNVPKIKTRGIPGGVANGSSHSTAGQGGTALTAAQHSALEYYTSRLVQALRPKS